MREDNVLKKFLIAAALATLVTAGAGLGVSQAKGGGGSPGPNGSNNHGLCTAYFNGQKNGWAKNGTPPPFQSLEDTANAEGYPNSSTTQNVYNWCTNADNNSKGIGGNPDQNGRFPSCFD